MRNSRKWQSFMLASIFGGALFFAPTAFAQSLWADAAEGTSYGVFADRKAHNVGDTLTIVISRRNRARMVSQLRRRSMRAQAFLIF